MTAQLRDTLTSVAVYYGDDSCRDACSAALGALAGILELPSLVSGVQEELESEAFFRQVGAVVVGLQDVAYTEGCLGACEGLLQDGDAPTRAGAIRIGVAVITSMRAKPGQEAAGEAMLAAVVGALADTDADVRHRAAQALAGMQALVPQR